MGTQGSASNNFDVVGLRMLVLACTDSPEIGHAGGGEPGPAGSKATATVLPAVTPQILCGVCTEPLDLQTKISS